MFNDFEKGRKERSAIQASRIIATAKAPARNGEVVIVAVYEMSNFNHYFFAYTAKTSRTPRRLWKIRNWNIVSDGREFAANGKGKLSLASYLDRLGSAIVPGAKWKIRYPHRKRVFTDHMDRIANPFDQAGFKPTIPAGATFVIASWHATGKKPNRYQISSLSTPKQKYTK